MPVAKAYSRSRPIRTAFLIDTQSLHAGEILSSIFAACMGRWGGRFSLIVPATASGPRLSYRPFLERFDADIIYSYVDLTNDVVSELHEALYPSYLTKHQYGRRDAPSFNPRLPMQPLSASTVLPRAVVTRFDVPQIARVLEGGAPFWNARLTNDSFGLFTKCIGTSFGPPLSDFCGSVYLSKDGADARRHYSTSEPSIVRSEAELLATLAEGKTITMAQLSALAAPRLEFSSPEVAFHLTVGNSIEDRLYHWNSRFLLPQFRDGSIVDLCVPEESLADPDLVNAIGKLLAKQVRIPGFGTQTPEVSVRSASVNAAKLGDFVRTLTELGRWPAYRVGVISSVDACLPSEQEIAHCHFTAPEPYQRFGDEDHHESQLQDSQFEIQVATPRHFEFAPAHMFGHFNGCWAIDVDIERTHANLEFMQGQERWVLPRRLRVASQFIGAYEIGAGSSDYAVARANLNGHLTVFTMPRGKLPRVTIPSDERAIIGAFTRGRDWWPFDTDSVDQISQAIADADRSSSGRQFWGVLGLLGGLGDAIHVLLNPHWRAIFAGLGAEDGRIADRRKVVVAQLQTRVQQLRTDVVKDMEKVASIVLAEAEHFRMHVPTLSWSELKRLFAETLDLEPQPQGFDPSSQQWREFQEREFPNEVQELCSKGVLHQGYLHKCSQCSHRTWISIERMRSRFTCEVCQLSVRAPVDRDWDFRMNEFLREALRQHGVLPLIWTLSRLKQWARRSFVFEGPIDLFIDSGRFEAGKPSTDVDLTCLVDRRVHLCHVKQSERGLTDKSVTGFIELAKRLRPDVAVLAVMGPASPKLRERHAEFARELAAVKIEGQLLTTDDQRRKKLNGH